jgi:hypothetical protein
MDDGERGAFAGACLAIASATLSTCDRLSTELERVAGYPAVKADEILALLALAHANGDDLIGDGQQHD